MCELLLLLIVVVVLLESGVGSCRLVLLEPSSCGILLLSPPEGQMEMERQGGNTQHL